MNFGHLLKAPVFDFEVTMHKRRCMNEYQNARKRIEYVRASCEKDALIEANKKRPEFKAMSARKVTTCR